MAALPGIPSTSIGTKAPPTVAVDAACGAMTPSGFPRPSVAGPAELPLDAVGEEGRDRRAGAGHGADQRAQRHPAGQAAAVAPDRAGSGHDRAHLGGLALALRHEAGAVPHQHVGHGVDADHDRQVVDAVAEQVAAEAEPHRAVDVVHPDGRDQHADHQRHQRAPDRVVGQDEDAGEADEDHQEVLGLAEVEGEPRDGLGDEGEHHPRHQPAGQRRRRPPSRAPRRHGPGGPWCGRPTAAARGSAPRARGAGSR